MTKLPCKVGISFEASRGDEVGEIGIKPKQNRDVVEPNSGYNVYALRSDSFNTISLTSQTYSCIINSADFLTEGTRTELSAFGVFGASCCDERNNVIICFLLRIIW